MLCAGGCTKVASGSRAVGLRLEVEVALDLAVPEADEEALGERAVRLAGGTPPLFR